MIGRDLKLRYSSSVLGYVWTLLDPLLLAGTYWFVFGFIVSRGSPNEQPYLLWLLTGILPFQWTSHVMNDCGRLLGNDAKLVTASSMPREIWVLRTVLSRFVEFIFTLPITIAAMVLFQVGPTWWLVMVPVAFLVQIVFNTGLGLILSPVAMLYPDVQRLVRVSTMLYRYLSPVIYSVATLEAALSNPDKAWPSWMLFGDEAWPSWIMDLYALNPLTGILDIYHAVLFTGNGTPGLLGVAAVVSLLTFAFGWQLFRRLEPRVLKEM